MLYPLNLFSTDPASGSIRPFIMFIIQEEKLNIMKVKSWKDVQHMPVPKGGFALPFPNGGLMDAVTNDYGTANALFEKGKSMIPGANNDTANGLLNQAGYVIDPLLTQTYKGNFDKFCNFHDNPHRSAPDSKRTFAYQEKVLIKPPTPLSENLLPIPLHSPPGGRFLLLPVRINRKSRLCQEER